MNKVNVKYFSYVKFKELVKGTNFKQAWKSLVQSTFTFFSVLENQKSRFLTS
jgi:hypothetical protein